MVLFFFHVIVLSCKPHFSRIEVGRIKYIYSSLFKFTLRILIIVVLSLKSLLTCANDQYLQWLGVFILIIANKLLPGLVIPTSSTLHGFFDLTLN